MKTLLPDNHFDASVMVVTANAGTGKTTALIDRVVALLITGVSPSSILCLTYTRNATTSMLQRLRERFLYMAFLSDDEMDRELKKLNLGPSSKHQFYARKMLIDDLSSSNSVHIQTIHGFCKDFLREHNIQCHMIESYQEKELRAQALHQLREKYPQKPYWKHFLINEDYYSFQQSIKHLFDQRLWLSHAFSDMDIDDLERFFNAPSKQQIQQKQEDLFTYFLQNRASLEEICTFFEKKQKTSISPTNILNNIFEKRRSIHDLAQFFLTKKFTIRKKMMNKDVSIEMHKIAKDVADKILHLLSLESLHAGLEETAMWKLLAQDLYQEYSTLLMQKDLINYDELLIKTFNLYKKNTHDHSRVMHLLVDEAQDLSALQWKIIYKLQEEALGVSGSFFVVGDDKQSIYRFQGADCYLFQNMCREAETKKYLHRLEKSYRSSPCLINFCNHVFSKIWSPPIWRHHHTALSKEGSIHLYHPTQRVTDEENKNSDQDHDSSLQSHLITQVQNLLKNGMKPSDIMLLFPARCALFYDLIHAMEKASIAVAEPDKYPLGESLVIWDLLACGHVALCPYNDMMLACVLKSLFGWNEHDLLILREALSPVDGASFYALLKERYQRNPNEKDEEILSFLASLQAKVFDNPLHFYQYLLHMMISHTSVYQHLISVERDGSTIINIFMDTLFQHQDVSLRTFLGTLDMDTFIIKREMPQDAISIMTVHGAKGLEAEAVFLIDQWKKSRLFLTFLPFHHRTKVLYVKNQHHWPDNIKDLFQEEKDAEREEKKRLMYVALTRAKNRLFLYFPSPKKATPWQPLRDILQTLSKPYLHEVKDDMLTLTNKHLTKNSQKQG